MTQKEIIQQIPVDQGSLGHFVPSYGTSVKLSSELGKITFSTGKPKLTPGEVSTFQGF